MVRHTYGTPLWVTECRALSVATNTAQHRTCLQSTSQTEIDLSSPVSPRRQERALWDSSVCATGPVSSLWRKASISFTSFHSGSRICRATWARWFPRGFRSCAHRAVGVFAMSVQRASRRVRRSGLHEFPLLRAVRQILVRHSWAPRPRR